MWFMMWSMLTCMPTPIQVLSKAEKRRKRKQQKAAANALNAQQQPASSAAAPLQPLYVPPAPPTIPADPVLSSSGARMPKQTVSSAHLPSPPEISVAQPPPNRSSPQLDDSPMPSHKSSEQMTAAKPESPQVADVPHGSLPSSSSRSPQARRSSSLGVPVLEAPSASSSSKVQSVASAHSAATAAPPVKADMASAPKPIARDPHTPPEQSNPRPSHSPPTPSALPAKNEPKGASTPLQTSSETSLPKNGQQQQQQESHIGKWTRQRNRRRRAQHGQKVQPNQPAKDKQAKAASVKTPAKQANIRNAHSSNKKSQDQLHTVQRQAASNIADLPLKAASLTEAADKHVHRIKPANWVPWSYSAAVGLASFGPDVVTPLVGHKAPIADLLKKHQGSPKHEQLNKLTTGSRPFTQYRSIRGEATCRLEAC